MRINEIHESHQQCPECGGPAFSDLLLAEKKDACYSKVRSRYKVWPSAYASGALVQCRKKGAANWGNKSKNEGVAEGYDTAEDYRAKAQWLRSELHLSPDEAWERAYDTDPETWVGSPWEDDYKQGMAEGYETTPFGGVTNTTPNYSQAWKVTDEGEEFLRKAYQRLKRAYKEGGQVEMINIGPALSELQQQKFGPAYVQQSGPYQMMTTDISRLIEKIEPWQKQYNQQHIATDFDPEDFSNWNKQQGMSENTSRKVDAKGRTQSEWMQAVKQKFPDAKIVQAKMIDGPAHALLSDGRKIVWNPVQGVAEVGQNFRRGNARRAALNAMSPEELRAHEEKRAEQQRKRDEARLERERQRNAAKKGVAEGLPQTLRKVVPGYAKREIDRKMDAGKFGKTDADKDANFYRYKKIQDKLKEQGVAEDYNPEYDDEAGMADNNLETLERAVQGIDDLIQAGDNLPEWCQEKIAVSKSMLVAVWDYMRSEEDRGATAELNEEFNLIESIVNNIAKHNRVDPELVWEDLESLTEDELYAFAVTSQLNEDWSKVNKRDKTDGMSQKAVNAYRREHPGSKLKTAVTTKPSKLKKGSKASKRRKSYCSRSRGQMKMHNISCAKTPDKAICKARRRWNC